MGSGIGLWKDWNEVDSPEPYGDSPTYQKGADWLKGCSLVEDWGCGKGWLSTLIEPERYRGVDGSSPFASVTADLAEYKSRVEGIFMRGVLEHNEDWEKVLTNALESFTERMVIVLFTPMAKKTKEIDWVDELGVPDISFSIRDLSKVISKSDHEYERENVDSPETFYGKETILYVQ